VAPTLDAKSQLSPSWRTVSFAVIWRSPIGELR
jgi:hypothetical protein